MSLNSCINFRNYILIAFSAINFRNVLIVNFSIFLHFYRFWGKNHSFFSRNIPKFSRLQTGILISNTKYIIYFLITLIPTFLLWHCIIIRESNNPAEINTDDDPYILEVVLILVIYCTHLYYTYATSVSRTEFFLPSPYSVSCRGLITRTEVMLSIKKQIYISEI